MIRFALIVASTLGFVLTAALGNFMAPLLQELERFRPQEQQEPQTPVQSRVPALGGLCLMVSTLAAVGVGWTAACIAQPTLLGSESQLMTRLLITLFGAQAFGAIGLADDAARLRSRAQLGLRRLPRLALEVAVAAAVLVLLAVNGCLPTGLQLPGAGYVSWAAQPRCCGDLCWWRWQNVPVLPTEPTAPCAARPLRPCWAS